MDRSAALYFLCADSLVFEADVPLDACQAIARFSPSILQAADRSAVTGLLRVPREGFALVLAVGRSDLCIDLWRGFGRERYRRIRLFLWAYFFFG